MPHAKVGQLEIFYEEIGPRDGVPMLLIMGLGAQLISWPDRFCELLAVEGFRVIRFDNRDVGMSSHLDELGVPDLRAVAASTVKPPYLLDDMAADAVGLLDELGVEEVHLVGASLGGVVAQVFTAAHPRRVRSLALVMTHPGRDVYVPPPPEGAAVLLSPRATTKEARIEQVLASNRVVGSRGELRDEDRVRDVAARGWDRGWNPRGFVRQLAANIATPNRLDALRNLDIPVVVLHGEADGLVPVANAHLLADAIPGAELHTFPDMGHDLPAPLWEPLTRAIARNAARAGLRPPSAKT